MIVETGATVHRIGLVTGRLVDTQNGCLPTAARSRRGLGAATVSAQRWVRRDGSLQGSDP